MAAPKAFSGNVWLRILLLIGGTIATDYAEPAEEEYPLDCLFEQGKALTACCWQSPAGNESQDSRAMFHEQVDAKWYAKRFRAVGLLPPESSFLALSADDEATIWESCDFCSSTGELELKLRHWQSATAELEICWRPSEPEVPQAEEEEVASCMVMDPRTQFSIDPMALRVPARMDMKIYFRLKNRSLMRTAVATVLIDHLQVHTQFCQDAEEQQQSTDLPSQSSDRAAAARLELDSDHLALPSGKQRTGDLVSYELLTEGQGRPSLQRAAPTRQMAEDPAKSIFGEAFTNFLLDPDFQGTDEEKQPAAALAVKKNIKRLNTVKVHRKLMKVHRNSQPCFTVGGCHFEQSACGFANSQTFSSNSDFLRKQIGDSYVVEARIKPGEIAVFQAPTNMTDGDYTVLFNHFESATSDSAQKPKFSACCYMPGRVPAELECPFQSGGDGGTNPFGSFGIGGVEKKPVASEWRAGSIACPAGTSKLMFTCEFFGTGSGICALDSVQLHRSDDKEFRQPCQIREEQEEE